MACSQSAQGRGRLARLITSPGDRTECASAILSRHCRACAAMCGSASAAVSSIPLSCSRSRRSRVSARAMSSSLDPARLSRCVGAAWMAPSLASASAAAPCGTIHPSVVHLRMPMMRVSLSPQMLVRACQTSPASPMPCASVRPAGTHATMMAVSTPPIGM